LDLAVLLFPEPEFFGLADLLGEFEVLPRTGTSTADENASDFKLLSKSSISELIPSRAVSLEPFGLISSSSISN